MVDTARYYLPDNEHENNTGDVLSSIRRLIAQGDSNDSGVTFPAPSSTGQAAEISPFPQRYPRKDGANPPSGNTVPLVLTHDEMIRTHDRAGMAVAAQSDDARGQSTSDEAPSLPDQASTELMVPQDEAAPTAAEPSPISTTHADSTEHPDMSQNIDSFTLHSNVDGSFDRPHQDSLAKDAGNKLNIFAMDAEQIEPDAPLKGLIRDALLRELQGEIGNRLSRNMRILIRAEIAQALKEAVRSE